MLKIISSPGDMDITALKSVYSESIINTECKTGESLYDAVNDFYLDSYRCLRESGTFYAVWIEDFTYISAVRLEPYRDGYLLCGIETSPGFRRKGYAGKLLKSVIAYLSQRDVQTLYSHISRKNRASYDLHISCGFKKIKDTAVFLDGSASADYVTLSYEIK